MSWLSATCYAHFIWHMRRIQLLKELPCRVRQQSTNSWKGFKQQVPFQATRKHEEYKWIKHPLNTTVIHKFYNTDCEVKLNFVASCLLGMQHRETDAISVPHSAQNCFSTQWEHGIVEQQVLIYRILHVFPYSAATLCYRLCMFAPWVQLWLLGLFFL